MPLTQEQIEKVEQIKRAYGIIGNSPLLNKAVWDVYVSALAGRNVFIQGETGVGKEAFAKIVAQESKLYFPGEFFSVNCSAFSPDLIDSYLFGHVKGAFTGADADHEGIFETCNNGTVFLDEVAELPLSAQSRLLRVLETGEYTRVGDNTVRTTRVRVVSATHASMRDAVQNQEFRADLFARLNMSSPVRIPALTDRAEDIPLLFNHFVRQYLQDPHHPQCEAVRLTEDGANFLKRQPWSGNVRDLREFAFKVTFAESGNRSLDEESLRSYLPETFLPATKKNPQLFYDELSSYTYLFTESLKSLQNEIAHLRSELNIVKSKLAEKDQDFASLLTTQPSIAAHQFGGVGDDSPVLSNGLQTHAVNARIGHSAIKESEEIYDYEEIVEAGVKKSKKNKK